ncbi:MAG: S8 family serine peptidase, partial [Burkholderiaceae bacterium]
MKRIQRIAMAAASIGVAASGAFQMSLAQAQSPQSFEIRQNLREGRAHVPEQMLVQFRAGVSEAEQTQLLGRLNAKRQEALLKGAGRSDRKGDLVLVTLPRGKAIAEAMTILEADGRVEFAEPNWIYTRQQVQNPDDTLLLNPNLWGMWGASTSP